MFFEFTGEPVESLILTNEIIHTLVMNQPVPMKLAKAIENAPNLTANVIPSGVLAARQHGMANLNPDEIPDRLLRALDMTCKGYRAPEVAGATYYSIWTVRDMLKGLRAVFGARNTTHLAALAVAQGYVDMERK